MPDPRLKPPCLKDDALAVVRRLREKGHVAYFAGGCVRDTLLGLAPKDFDVATDAIPRRVRDLFSNTQAVGQAFGVILVRHGQSVVEVATFRSDGAYTDGRRPDHVTFSSPPEDAQRRDFTINGLFLDPLDGDRVIDFVGGLDDLRARLLRAIGDPKKRFAEDHLRLLRAVRFASRFNLAIEDRTAAAIESDAPLLARISPERIADELRTMLTPPTRNAAYILLWRFGLAPVILRFITPSPPAPDPAASLFTALPGDAIPLGLSLSAMVLDIMAPTLPDKRQAQHAVRALRQSLKISNDESGLLEQILLSLPSLLQADYPSVAALKRFLAAPAAPAIRALLSALRARDRFPQRIDRLASDLARLEQTDFAPPPLINGDDLQALGLVPGPAFKRILEQVYDAQLEEKITTRDQALSLAHSLTP